MKKSILTSVLALSISFSALAQKNVIFTIKHKLGSNNFAFNQATSNDLSNNFSVTRIDYYVSKFVIIHDGAQTLSLPDSVIVLAKGTNNVSVNLGNYNVTNVEGITFSVGVPQSLNNTDPTLYKSPNPLAPQSPSMHWGWTAGFRFVAIEGKSGAVLNTTYEMHGLFNANYFSQTKMVTGVNSGNTIYINLDADYTKALKGINVTQGPIDHGVNATDLKVLQNFRDFVFSAGTGLPSAIASVYQNSDIRIFPNPSNGEITINNENNDFTALVINDITGKEIIKMELSNTAFNMINIPEKGIYVIVLKANNGASVVKKVIVE